MNDFTSGAPTDAYNDSFISTSTAIVYLEQDGHGVDKLIAPGIRIWMILAMIGTCFTVLTTAICCVTKYKIPRTRREMRSFAEFRKKKQDNVRKKTSMLSIGSHKTSTVSGIDELRKSQKNVIIMQSLVLPSSRNSTMMALTEMMESLEEADEDEADAEQDTGLTICIDSSSYETKLEPNNNDNGVSDYSKLDTQGIV